MSLSQVLTLGLDLIKILDRYQTPESQFFVAIVGIYKTFLHNHLRYKTTPQETVFILY